MSLILTKLANQNIGELVKSDSSCEQHPETVDTTIRIEIILTTLLHDLCPAVHNISVPELNDSFVTRHIRWLVVFKKLITTFAHTAQSSDLVCYLYREVNRNMMMRLIPIPSHRKNIVTIKKALVIQTNE